MRFIMRSEISMEPRALEVFMIGVLGKQSNRR